jgi:hypothetical protein
MNDRMTDRENLIKGYFKMGFAFSEITQILSQTHGKSVPPIGVSGECAY